MAAKKASPHQPKKKTSPAGEYKVGYKKPPKEHQFKKGQSGNPKGRPPKQIPKLSDQIAAVINREVPIMRNGVEETMPAFSVMLESLMNEAMKSNTAAVRLVSDLIVKFGPSFEDLENPDPITVENEAQKREALQKKFSRFVRKEGADPDNNQDTDPDDNRDQNRYH